MGHPAPPPRAAPQAITVIQEYESGAKAAQRAEARRGTGLSARCRRLEENMLENLSALQSHRRGLEDVVQRRKEQAERIKKGLKEDSGLRGLSEGIGSATGSTLGIAPLNFRSMKERCQALQETVDSNQDTLMSQRSVLDQIIIARRQQESARGDSARSGNVESARAASHAESADGQEAPYVDRCRVIEENARKIGVELQARADSATGAEEDADQTGLERYEKDCRAATEARHYILFGKSPEARPSSAPPGAFRHPPRPSSSASSAVATYSARPASSASYYAGSASRPLSARSRGLSKASVPSRPCSANSMTARCKALEDNLNRNKKILTYNRDGLEEVRKRREAAAKAMAAMTQPISMVVTET